MSPSRILLATLCAVLLLAPTASAADPAAGLRDLDGKAADPFTKAKAKLLAFVFVCTECPVANVYAPEIQRLAKRYAEDGVAFHLVYCDGDESPAAIRKHLTEYGYKLPAFRDTTKAFAKRSNVTITPEVALYQANGELLFHGRIDDRYLAYGKARAKPTHRDLTLAIDAALAGKPVPKAKGAAVGCYIDGL